MKKLIFLLITAFGTLVTKAQATNQSEDSVMVDSFAYYLLPKTIKGGQEAFYKYDAAGRITWATYPTEGRVSFQHYTYDRNSNILTETQGTCTLRGKHWYLVCPANKKKEWENIIKELTEKVRH